MKKCLMVFTFAIILVLGGIIFSSSQFTFEKNKENDKFPQNFAGMQRIQLYSDAQAIDDISKLHGKNIELKQGYVVSYQGDRQVMRLWLSLSPTPAKAQELFQVMDEKMKYSQVFSGRKKLPIDNVDVVYVYGMDMANYYYVIDNRVYWFAISGENSLQTLRQALKTF